LSPTRLVIGFGTAVVLLGVLLVVGAIRPQLDGDTGGLSTLFRLARLEE
jgi:hypothetical protein